MTIGRDGSNPQELRKHSVLIAGHATSVSLEEPFWAALKRIAAARGQSLNALITEIDDDRGDNLSSTLRVYVLDWLERHSGNGKPD